MKNIILKPGRKGSEQRVIFKLKEIDEKYNLFANAHCVLDLGSAPGSWVEYSVQVLQRLASTRSNGTFYILGVDRVRFHPIEGADILQADITCPDICDVILAKLPVPPDLILSDCAPHVSGQRGADHDAQAYLFEQAVTIADRILVTGGTFVGKLFQGAEFNRLLAELRKKYGKVHTIKPNASRPGSPEMYSSRKGLPWASCIKGNPTDPSEVLPRSVGNPCSKGLILHAAIHPSGQVEAELRVILILTHVTSV